MEIPVGIITFDVVGACIFIQDASTAALTRKAHCAFRNSERGALE